MNDQLPPDGSITIYCNAASHNDRPRFEWKFVRVQHPNAGRIFLERTEVPRMRRTSNSALTPAVVILNENNRPYRTDESVLPGDTTRHKWSFECSLCGDKFSRRGEGLDPVIDMLIDAGVSEISLRALAARVPR